jgi:hypothetical protein
VEEGQCPGYLEAVVSLAAGKAEDAGMEEVRVSVEEGFLVDLADIPEVEWEVEVDFQDT